MPHYYRICVYAVWPLAIVTPSPIKLIEFDVNAVYQSIFNYIWFGLITYVCIRPAYGLECYKYRVTLLCDAKSISSTNNFQDDQYGFDIRPFLYSHFNFIFPQLISYIIVEFKTLADVGAGKFVVVFCSDIQIPTTRWKLNGVKERIKGLVWHRSNLKYFMLFLMCSQFVVAYFDTLSFNWFSIASI